MRFLERLRGFTLVEILVGLSIISLLFVAGYASYREFALRQQVVQVAELVRSDILLLQQKALSGDKPTACPGPLHGYIVRVGTSTYDVYADCSGGAGVIDVSDPLVKFVNLPAGITNSSGTKTILFKVLGQGTNLPTSDSIVLTQSMTGRAATLLITPTGQVDLQTGTATPPPDTQGGEQTPTPSPTPTPTPTWKLQETSTYGCNSSKSVSYTSQKMRIKMLSGGGGDCTISLYCLGSNGASWVADGTRYHLTNQTCPLRCGEIRETADFGAVRNVTQQDISVGCNDGETATFEIWRFAP